MADEAVDVVVQIATEDVPAGRLWAHRHGRAESATFEYLPAYLARNDSYELGPTLPKRAGQQQTPLGHTLFGAFSDVAPDGWGRRLIQRNESRRARALGAAQREVAEIDYLLGVRDDLRQGALRFRDPHTGRYLAEDHAGVPHVVDLRALLAAAEQLEREEEVSNETLALLLDGGSSLGGARPKAHVLDSHGTLGIAKFPAPAGDDWDVVRWEAVALMLARDAGLLVPEFELHEVGQKPVLVTRRFDRDGRSRIGYVSAMTMLEARHGDRGAYLEIAEAIEDNSPAATVDLRQLWRRIVFSRLISNTDDHLRNHGFLRMSTAGWSLAPAFDLNPNPRRSRFATTIDGSDAESELAVALGVAELFRLTHDEAAATIADVSEATSRWRDVASAVGIPRAELELMEGAFDRERARFTS